MQVQGEHMKALKTSLAYFAGVFSIGFVLGAIRQAVVVERLGERWAELLELPLMVVASFVAARICLRHFGPFATRSRLGIGVLALLFMLAAELSLNLLTGQKLAEYIASRDPVSGTAYLVALALFALMPLVADRGSRNDNPT